MKHFVTTSERISPRELMITRDFDAPARLIFAAWSQPDLLRRWWVPKSIGITLVSCEADVRTGGTYRFEFGHPDFDQPMAFFGRYLEVIPDARIVWTNEESPPGSVTTLTLTETNGLTRLVIRDLYPSQEVLDEAIASGSTAGYDEQFEQLDLILTEG